MCDACKNLSKIWDGSQKLLVSRFNDAKTKEPTFILVQDNGAGGNAVSIKVRFCPWCGENLMEGKGDVTQD